MIRFGIHGVITERKVKYKGEYNNKAYILSIDNLIDAYKFQKEIPLLSKKDKLDNILSEYQSVNSKLTTIPKSFLPFLKQKLKIKKNLLTNMDFQ